jgi:hypothetical protein
MSRLACSVLILLSLCASPVSAQGALQRARSATHDDTGNHSAASPPANTPTNGPRNDAPSSVSNWGSGVNGEGAAGLAALAVITATSPFWVPHFLLGDNLSSSTYFPGHPYALEYSRYLHTDVAGMGLPFDQDKGLTDPEFLKWWSLRLSLEDGNDFRGMNRFNGSLFLDTSMRIGVQTSWNYFRERLDGGGSDESVQGVANLTFRFAQCEWVQMHTGVGVRLLTDRTDTRAGFNFLYGMDLFPTKPLVLSSLFEGGTLDSAWVLHGRGTFGVLYRRYEFFGGYDFLRIGSVNLQGPVVGLRLWF